ncbi:MAG: hypothetical protein PHC80_02050 [Eubacteriales bacterium]|nr:hypothetical protein [Eubacteriales bacterium]
MIQEINNGDKDALRNFLHIYAKHILDRATAQTPDELHAREATRMTILAITTAANAGQVPGEPVPWVDKLTDESVARLSMPLDASVQPVKPEAPQAAPTPEAPPWENAVPMRVEPALETPYYTEQAQSACAYADYAAPETIPAAAPVYMPAEAAPAEAYAEPAPTRITQTQQTYEPVVLFDKKKKSDPFYEDDDFEFEEEASGSRRKKGKEDAPVGLVFLIFLMALVVLGLIWMLLVMLMAKGYLPVMDFGFAQWFNEHVFMLF